MEVPTLVISQSGKNDRIKSGNSEFISFDERGLSKSRNRAIENSQAEIALIADDDVEFVSDFNNKILAAFTQYPKADIITFQVRTPEGIPYKNSYSDRSFQHGRRSIYKVSSVEIAIRPERIRSKGLRFDERFGLGAKYSSGEEVIFLNDCIDAGLSLRYVPEEIVIHPLESSGKVLNENYFRSKGAIVRRLYGFTPALIIGIGFLLKQLIKRGKTLSFAAALRASFEGFFAKT
ncbi:glycosyltransferase family 2 protein [Algoriphagus formosus]|uniref:glycosyltransferase family 2 protein n=1 Tax=Algoriphagus formosus TaxID=2007308 RepID=UPI003F6EDF5A